MAPLPDVPSTLRVALVGSEGLDADIVTRFFITYTGTAPTATQMNTFCTAVGTAWGTNLKALVASGFTLATVNAEDLTSSTAAIGTAAPNIASTRAGGELPADVCALTRYKIARRYRGGHPRGYWRAGSLTDIGDPQQWSGAFTTAWNTGIAAFFTAVLAAGWTGAGTLSHTNVSFYSGFTVAVDPVTGRARNVPTKRVTPLLDAVTSAVLAPNFASQRRRNEYV